MYLISRNVEQKQQITRYSFVTRRRNKNLPCLTSCFELPRSLESSGSAYSLFGLFSAKFRFGCLSRTRLTKTPNLMISLNWETVPTTQHTITREKYKVQPKRQLYNVCCIKTTLLDAHTVKELEQKCKVRIAVNLIAACCAMQQRRKRARPTFQI